MDEMEQNYRPPSAPLKSASGSRFDRFGRRVLVACLLAALLYVVYFYLFSSDLSFDPGLPGVSCALGFWLACSIWVLRAPSLATGNSRFPTGLRAIAITLGMAIAMILAIVVMEVVMVLVLPD